MSKQNLVIIIVIIMSLVLGGLFGFYFYLNHKAAGQPSDTSGSSGFFGFGGSRPIPTPSEPSDTATTTPVVTVTVPKPIPILRHLTEAPVAGSAFILKDLISTSTILTGSTTKSVAKIVGSAEMFRWIDRATGNIFETSSTTLETVRISNTTIPKVYEAYFVDSKGNGVIFRDLIGDSDVIRTQYGSLQLASSTSMEQSIKLTELPVNLTQMAVSANHDQIFGILPGTTRGVLLKPDGSNETGIFNSAFHEWLVSWPASQTVVLNTKPSGTADGFAYALDTKSKAVTKIVGGKKGLTTLMSPNGVNVLVGESPLGTMQTNVFNRKSGELRSLFIRTLPEKCVWSKKEAQTVYCAIPESARYDTYPDAWYMGNVSFSDNIWKIDTSTGESRQIAEPVSLVGQPIDIFNISLSRDEDFLMFQDKNDLSLWSYQLSATAQ